MGAGKEGRIHFLFERIAFRELSAFPARSLAGTAQATVVSGSTDLGAFGSGAAPS